MDLATAIYNYLEYLRSERRLAVNTLQSYLNDLEKFLGFSQHYGVTQVIDIDNMQIQEFLFTLKNCGARSKQRYLASIRGLLNYLLRNNIITANPAHNIPQQKTKKLLPSLLDVDEIQHLLEQPITSALLQRDLTIIELLYSTGMRISELAKLNIHDITAATDHLLTITGKGDKMRRVPIGLKARTSLQAYMHVRLSYAAVDDALFIALKPPHHRLTIRALQKRLFQLGLKLGLHQRLHPHMLRHSCASHLLESSGDLSAVQTLLGHENLATTEIYTRLNFQHLASVYDKAHPRAKLLKD